MKWKKTSGNCCIHREDILLNPQDIFRMAKELKLSVVGFMACYCECYIGKDSKIPLVRLKPRGSVKRCPLLKDRKCMVHDEKPVVCAMFPIGRCIVMGPGEEGKEDGSGIQYVINQTSCGEISGSPSLSHFRNEKSHNIISNLMYVKTVSKAIDVQTI